jgi:hypothetical protein
LDTAARDKFPVSAALLLFAGCIYRNVPSI